MKRRRFIQALAFAPAAPAALAQQPVAPAPPAPAVAGDFPNLDVSVADAGCEMTPHFFNAQQFAALRKLAGILMPAMNSAPGAIDAHAPEFLDFLIEQSPLNRQQVYRSGLDALNAQSKKRFNMAFAEVDASQADELLQPLREPWSYDPPADPLARFLWAAKEDIRTATINSREWNAAALANGRRAGGSGLYWYLID